MKPLRALASFFFILLLTPSLGAQAPDWKPFSSPPDGFSVEFPGIPKLTEEKDQEIIHRRFTVSTPGRGYYVLNSNFGEEIPAKFVESSMNIVRDGLVQGLKGKLSEEKPVKCGQSPGRSFVISGPEGVSSVLLCSAGKRMYVVYAGSVKGPLPAADLARFQGSFKLMSPTP